MNLLEISLRRPVFAWILMSALIVFGAISFNKLGISQMPDVNFPILNITIPYEGAAPEVIESEIIDKTERALLSVEGIKEMRSSATQGSASITLEFDINRNVDVALQEVQSALSRIRFAPEVDNPVVRKSNPEEDPILIVSLYGDKPVKDLINWANTFLLDQLQFIQGVGEIDFGGFPDRNLRIWIDSKKLAQNDLTITDVIDAIKTQHIESSAGQFVDGKREIRVRYMGEAKTITEIGNIPILKRGGQSIQDRKYKIKDVATIEDGLADIRRVATFEGKNAVTVRIKKQRGTNEVQVAERVVNKLKEIKFPEGMNYRINVDFTKSTKATVELTVEKIWVASIITILVCFLFLGNLQSAINILFSIPTSVFGTFIVLYFSGFTLNLFTLLALTLSISIVVDDAIMLLENIVRHHRMGKTPYQAAKDGSKEVLPAAIAATLAVLAVFLPVIFMDGIVGKFFLQFGITMAAAALLSLLEAVTITPMRAAAFLSIGKGHSKLEVYLDQVFEKWNAFYQRLLKVCLRFKWPVLVLSLSFFILSLLLLPKVKQEFVPSQDQNIIILTAQTKPGTSLPETEKLVEPLKQILSKTAGVHSYLISVGPGSVFVPIALVPMEERKITHQQIMADIRESAKSLKGLRVSMRDISARNLTTGRLNPIAFNLRGPDLEVLNDKTNELMDELQKRKLAVDMDTDYRMGLPELAIIPNREKMYDKAVSVDEVSQVLLATLSGYRAGQFMADGKENDIRFKVLDDEIQSPKDIQMLTVRNNFGNLIRLKDVVDLEEKKSLQSISRINRQRAVSAYGNLGDNQSQSIVLEKAKEIAIKILPDGYTFNLEGAASGFSSSFKSLTTALLAGILVAYMILAVQFNSFRDPISILMALPFSISGAFIVLWATNISLNLFSFIGLIVLMGIAKKNSIMLVEFTTHTLRKDRTSYYDALVKACPIRLRPILMTSVATILAALPLVIGGGLGHEARKPMGLVIIGGTVVSTLFTLFVVPVLYFILADLFGKKQLEKIRNRQDAETQIADEEAARIKRASILTKDVSARQDGLTDRH